MGKQVSFMERLTLSIIVAVILFAAMYTWMTGLTTAVNGIATYYIYDVPTVVNGTVQFIPTQVKPPFAQPYWELAISFAVGFIPIAIAVWDHKRAKENETSAQESSLTTTDVKNQVEIALNNALPTIITKIVEAQGSKKSPNGPPETKALGT